MNNLIYIKRILITIFMVISVILFIVYYFSKKEAKEDIYPVILDGAIWENEINLEKFSELQKEEYWIENPSQIKLNDFNFEDMKNLGNIFGMWYCIGFDKGLYGEISNVAFELKIPEYGKNNFMYYTISSEHPFDGFLIEENGDGAYQIVLFGATRDKSNSEIRELVQDVVINLYIQYEDGKQEIKPMKFGDSVTCIDYFTNEKPMDILVESTEKAME